MRLAPLLAVLLVAGCSTAPALQGQADCALWYETLDRMVDDAGVRDAQYSRLEGFPYLRVDRFHASLAERARANERAFAARLLELDLDARRVEIANLPDMPGNRAVVRERAGECGRKLLDAQLAKPDGARAIVEAARVPDDYSTVARVLGLYALTRIPFAYGVRKWEDSRRAALARPPARDGTNVLYSPPGPPPLSRAAVAGLLARARLDPFGQPLLTEREVELLAQTYAPIYEIATAADYDRFGAVRWRAGERMPQIDAADAVVYVQPAYVRYGERVLVQLVYTLWFSERPRQRPLDLLAGRLDGLAWRVTLAPDGEPVVYDSMHPCGCYHEFFPTARAKARAAPRALEEWAFVPRELPRAAEGERPLVRIESATHYIAGVDIAKGEDSLVRYSLRPYDRLRSLPGPQGGRRSLFGADGLVAGTERLERFFFWPMGIASAGAMRQWGRHATAFVGRRHFDDADLIERRFDIEGIEGEVAR
jgi:hypothetical protein